MGRTSRRLLVGAATLFGVWSLMPAAGAKVLPVDAVRVPTAHPMAGRPITVEMRFRRGFDIGDFAWERNEILVFPGARVDAAGWPADINGTTGQHWVPL